VRIILCFIAGYLLVLFLMEQLISISLANRKRNPPPAFVVRCDGGMGP